MIVIDRSIKNIANCTLIHSVHDSDGSVSWLSVGIIEDSVQLRLLRCQFGLIAWVTGRVTFCQTDLSGKPYFFRKI